MAGPDTNKALVIGGSAGAFEVLSTLIPALRADIEFPVLVVIHLPPHKPSLIADLLHEKSAVSVKEAQDKEIMQPAHVYIAPPNYHMLVEHDGSLSLSVDEPVLYSRPSIDVLFETAADAYKQNLTAIILSGANADGAGGLKKVFDQGGTVIVQDPKGASAKTMPRSAIKTVPESEIKPVAAIKDFLSAL